MSTPRALSIAEQMDVLRSNADVATFALEHLGLPAAWRDTTQPENTARCQDAVNRVFSLTRADIEAALGTMLAGTVANNYRLVREAIDRGVPIEEVKTANNVVQDMRKILFPEAK